jgi:NTP pyrophosphatase (non-canonical NTP hydrolase)
MKPGLSTAEQLTNWALGMAGEAGETVEHVKKHVFHNKPLSIPAIEEELGDQLFYLVATATTLGISMDRIMERNKEKLTDRYPKGFTTAA